MTDKAVLDEIKGLVESADVILFMKGTPSLPQCGFSATVAKILQHVGVDFQSVNVLARDEIREGIKAYGNWPTIPQLYVKGELVGGCDIVREMFETGELRPFLESQGVLQPAG